VSEENNYDQLNPQSQNPEDEAPHSLESWEVQLQARANELLAQRMGLLRSEIERLQATINEISTRLIEQAQTEPTREETSGLLDYIRGWFNDSASKAEEDFTARLEQARNEARAAGREEAEQEFQERLKQAARDWEDAQQMANEASFQKRLEQACTEAAAVARRESEVQIEDLREQLEASRKALTLAVSSAQSASAQSTSFDQLRSAIDEIDGQRTQSETLTSLVRHAARFAPRVVFFVVKGGDAVGWRASGFENGLNDETVRLLNVPTQNPSLLQESLTGFRTAIGRSSSPGENSAVLGLYGSPAPERAIAVPLVVRGKAAAVLYADSGTHSENSINTSAIETLMRVASMGIELLPARRGFEPPRPHNPASQLGAAAAQAVAPAPFPEPSRVTAPVPEEAQDKIETSVDHEATRPVTEEFEPVKEVGAGVETPQASQPEWAEQVRTTEELIKPREVVENLQEAEAYTYRPVEVGDERETKALTYESAPSEVVSAGPESAEVEQYEQAETQTIPPPPPAPPIGEERPSFNEMSSAPTVPMTPRQTLDIPREQENVQYQEQPVEEQPSAPSFTASAEPPRPAQSLPSVPTPASETEQRAHNDARRFARLLVSEIKLYNAAKVNEGRRNFDLYERLKDEIDRSRKVYDKRVSPAVAARFDYFYDELVQTLAEGDPAKLGPGCPGPVVLAS
jgi:hypothetical protein